jgi:hypothetical protein
MTPEARAYLRKYAESVTKYLDGGVAGRDFIGGYFSLNRQDPHLHGEPVGMLLMNFFVTVECYEPDPELLAELERDDPGVYFGDAAFRAKAREFLAALKPHLAGAA